MLALTPNERRRLIQAERDRRRIARLQQVRQLSRKAAEKVRTNTKELCQQEITTIREQLSYTIDVEAPEIVHERLHLSSSSCAQTTISSMSTRRVSLSQTDCQRAAERGKKALELQRTRRIEEKLKREQLLQRRRRALQIADRRNRPKPPSSNSTNSSPSSL